MKSYSETTVHMDIYFVHDIYLKHIILYIFETLGWLVYHSSFDWLPAGLFQPVIGSSVSHSTLNPANSNSIRIYSVDCSLSSAAALPNSVILIFYQSLCLSHCLFDYYCIEVKL